jgi:thiol-disulfide isomerase/thioredoxin/tetratricopeptide (TPR) repeat protein
MLRCSAVALFFLARLPLGAQPCDPLPPIRDVHNGVAPADIREDYRAQRDAHPDDPLYATQYARALTGADTPQAIQLLDLVLTTHPDYAPAYLQLALIYNSAAFHDAAKLKTSLERMWKVCPASFEGYGYVTRADDEGFAGRAAARLRALIEKRDDDAALAAYRTLWKLEFKSTPLAGQEAVRERVRKDTARLRQVDLSQHASVLGSLEEAYKTLGDADGTKWVESQRSARTAAERPIAVETISGWIRTHERGRNRQTYNEDYLKQSEEWIRQWPDDPYVRMQGFYALRSARDAELEVQVDAAEEWIRVYEAHPSGPSPYLQVASFYNSKNMRYAELPGLVEKGLKEIRPPAVQPVSDLSAPRAGSLFMLYTPQWSAWSTAANVYLKTKHYDDARKILSQFGASLRDHKPPAEASANDKRSFESYETRHWGFLAKLAHADGHRLDEMAYLRSAGLTNPHPLMNTGGPVWMEQVRQIWEDLGGTEDGLQAWLRTPNGGAEKSKPTPATRTAAVSKEGDWTTLDKPLPDFHLADFQSKLWTPADFKGKVTLITLWATWCGPCRIELPFVQKLYEKVRERSDLQVLTFDVDEELGLILPFLTENKYTFPVVSGKDYIDNMPGQWSIPRTWVVDSTGILRAERIGFGVGDDKWVDDAIRAMEKAR